MYIHIYVCVSVSCMITTSGWLTIWNEKINKYKLVTLFIQNSGRTSKSFLFDLLSLLLLFHVPTRCAAPTHTHTHSPCRTSSTCDVFNYPLNLCAEIAQLNFGFPLICMRLLGILLIVFMCNHLIATIDINHLITKIPTVGSEAQTNHASHMCNKSF